VKVRRSTVVALVVLGSLAVGCVDSGAPPLPVVTTGSDTTTRPVNTDDPTVETSDLSPETSPPETSPPETSSPETSSPETTADPVPLADPIIVRGSDVPPGLVELARFVEDTRGHPFLRPVTVELVADDRFEELIVDSFGGPALEALQEQYELMVLIGLLPEGIDFVDLVRISDRESIIGFYVPGTDTLHLRGAELTSFVSMVAVHELTHALDDQWFDLAPERHDDDADRAFALAALAEGSATWVEEQWIAGRSIDERVEVRRAGEELWVGAVEADWPVSAIEIGEDVYSLGSSFVVAMPDDDVAASLDVAFTDRPDSTEQLLHPSRYRAGDVPIDVATPDHVGVVVAEGTIGELLLVELLSAAVSPATAREAGEGWGGDRYVVVDDGARRCLVLEVRTDTGLDEVELAAATGRWAARQPDATVTRDDGTVRVVSCRDVMTP